jgi:hypothetical protein
MTAGFPVVRDDLQLDGAGVVTVSTMQAESQ